MTTENDWLIGQLGTVRMSPQDPVPAGTFGSWTFRYTTGPYGVDDGGGLLFLVAQPSDRGTPQVSDPTAADYVTVTTTGDAQVTARHGKKLHIRPWREGIAVDVHDGSLAPGDVVELRLGDRSGGSPGARAQSFAEAASRVKVMIDPFATNRFYELPGETAYPVIAGPATRLRVLAPSAVRPGEPVVVSVSALDRFGNVATDYHGELALTIGDQPLAEGAPTAGVWTTRVDLPPGGPHRIRAVDRDAGLAAESNPIGNRAQGPQLLWGDTQAQTGETVGAGDLGDFLHYARDVAQLDFVTHSANDFQVEDAFYAEVWDAVDQATVDGSFVAIGGYEWSGNTPVGGDHNVLYADRQQAPLHRSSHALVDEVTDVDTDRRTITELNETLLGAGSNAICVPHVGGRVARVDLIDPRTSPVLEIVSVHGWFEWFAREALQRGLEVGFLGASDDHTCRPGGSFPSRPQFGVRSGLAGVWADELSRPGILDALRARHCFATTGERIWLDVRSGDHRMGDQWSSDTAPQLAVTVRGTAGIEKIDLMGPHGPIQTWRPEIAQDPNRIRISWSGARHRFRRRTLQWDGELTVDGARIVEARPWAFDHPDQGITDRDDHRVSWHSTTNGDHDGIELELDSSDGQLCFRARDIDLRFDLSTLTEQGRRVELDGLLDAAVEVTRLPATAPSPDVELTLTPDEFGPGVNPYFVRVQQADGHLAWSSPVFVTGC